MAANNIAFALGDGVNDYVTFSEGRGNFILDTNGLAGELSGGVVVDIPGAEVSGSLLLQVNQTGMAVNELFDVGGSSVLLNLAAGTYIKVAGQGIAVDIMGQTLEGNFSFLFNQTDQEVQLDVSENQHAKIRAANAILKSLSLERGFVFIDLHPHFCDPKGQLREELTIDGVHLTPEGYALWRKLLAKYIDE